MFHPPRFQPIFLFHPPFYVEEHKQTRWQENGKVTLTKYTGTSRGMVADPVRKDTYKVGTLGDK